LPKFELHQIRLESVDRYYLPLPKLTAGQLSDLGSRLSRNGLSVRTVAGERLHAGGGHRSLVVARSGLAWSGSELLDALAPAVPDLLSHRRAEEPSNPYYAAKRIDGGFEVQFFLRMEGLRLWTALRSEGECGLTPDEKVVASRLLLGSDRPIECVTDYPTDDGSLLRVGRRQYFRSLVSPEELVDRLRTTSSASSRNCYLPRSSVVRLNARVLPACPAPEELGEWCYVEFPPKSL
jgi:hypothetical protein